MNCRAILFDFDGVLAHTMPFHLAAWNQVLEQEYGFSLDPMSVKLNEGRPVAEIAAAIFRDAGKNYTPAVIDDIITKKNELFRASHKSTVFPENVEIMRRAKVLGIKVGLVTGTKRANLGVIVPEELLARFDIIITDGDTARGKPAPDPYLAAAAKLGISPHECIVIENAPAGIQAAKSAGMFCCAIKTTLAEEHLREADVSFEHHSQLLAWLERKVFIPQNRVE